MKYRKFGSLNWNSSILAFGTGRLPRRGGGSTLIEETASIEMIRYAIDCGVNYIDLSHSQDLERQKQIAGIVAKALQDGYSERVKVAVTLPSQLIHSRADFNLLLDRQLGWLHADSVDFCLFGRLNREIWPILNEFGALDWADASIDEGLIENIGFSFHDHFQILKSVLAAYDRWALCQFQFSYMDVDHDPGISGIKYVAEKGLAVVVTESLRGGRLINALPDSVAKIWGGLQETSRLAEWGLHFVWNYPEVSTIICNMSRIYEIDENASIADSSEPDSFTVQDEVLISRVRDAYRESRCVPCSSCRPCMPCPEGIDVPRIFEIYNDAFIYEDLATARSIYLEELHQADRCNKCRDCEKRCTKKLNIVGWLEKADRLLSGSG